MIEKTIIAQNADNIDNQTVNQTAEKLSEKRTIFLAEKFGTWENVLTFALANGT